MDRRTKVILLSIFSVILLAVVFWFLVWPILSPVLPTITKKAQPPAVGTPNPANPDYGTVQTGSSGAQGGTVSNTVNFDPASTNPDILRIAELSRRAGVFAERMESGSSEAEFQNISDAILESSASLAVELRAQQSALRAKYKKDGAPYITIARRLVEIPESESLIEGDTFSVRVQMQVQTKDNGKTTVEYREATIVFTFENGDWIVKKYTVAPFTL